MSVTEKPFTGLTASVKIDSILLGYMSGIDMTVEKSVIDILTFGSKWKEKVPAVHDWSATVDGTIALVKGGSQEMLWNAYNNDTEVELGIYLNETTYFTGKAYVTSLKISGSPDDKISISADLSGTEAVILTMPQQS